MTQQWLSIVEYARAFSVSDMTVRRRIRTGKLEADLRDGKYFIPVHSDENGNATRQPSNTQSVTKSHPVVARQPRGQAPIQHQAPKIENKALPEQALSANHGEVARKTIERPVKTNKIPNSLTSKLIGHMNTTVNSNDILKFCDQALMNADEQLKQVESRYKEALAHHETKLEMAHHELNQLRQQVEDLQLLVQVLEQKLS